MRSISSKCPARSGSRRRRLSLGRAHVQGDHAAAAAGLNRFMGPRDLCQWKAPLDHRGQLARLGQLREAAKAAGLIGPRHGSTRGRLNRRRVRACVSRSGRATSPSRRSSRGWAISIADLAYLAENDRLRLSACRSSSANTTRRSKASRSGSPATGSATRGCWISARTTSSACSAVVGAAGGAVRRAGLPTGPARAGATPAGGGVSARKRGKSLFLLAAAGAA